MVVVVLQTIPRSGKVDISEIEEVCQYVVAYTGKRHKTT